MRKVFYIFIEACTVNLRNLGCTTNLWGQSVAFNYDKSNKNFNSLFATILWHFFLINSYEFPI